MIEIKLKPLSVNSAFKGRRFRTDDYNKYIRNMLFLLPKIEIGPAPYELSVVFGYSSKASDIDNGLKSFLDCLVKKYGFDDRDIYKLNVKKEIVKKGEEFTNFEIKSI